MFDHVNNNEPMAANKFTDKHKFIDGFILEGHLRNFIYKDISKMTGMSFDDYLARPRYEIELINSVVESVAKEKAKNNQQLLDGLKSEVVKSKMDPTS